MKSETNKTLEEIKKDLRYIWLHRKGNEVHGAIQDTIDALYKEGLKPKITRKFKLTEEAWEFHLNLPPGLSYPLLKKQETYFADAVGGTALIEKRGKLIKMNISTCEIQSKYPYSFNPALYPELFLPVHFGFSAIGEVVKDLSSMPNMIIAGHPGAGKSNFIHGLTVGLILNEKNPTLIVMLDFKRLEYAYLREHILLVTEIDFARAALGAINKELNKRLETLERANVVKIQDYIEQGNEMPFVVLIIDELAEMQDEECQQMLNRILRLGRACGICVVCATQRPSSTMMKAFGDSKAMFACTMVYHVRDAVNSQMLLDSDKAAMIPNIPGRGIFQWDDELEVQSMFLPTAKAKKLLKGIQTKQVVNLLAIEESPKRKPPR